MSIYVLEGDYMQIDIEKLRKDLEDYYGTAMANGFPAVVVDLSKAEKSSQEVLVKTALKEGFDPEDYEA